MLPTAAKHTIGGTAVDSAVNRFELTAWIDPISQTTTPHRPPHANSGRQLCLEDVPRGVPCLDVNAELLGGGGHGTRQCKHVYIGTVGRCRGGRRPLMRETVDGGGLVPGIVVATRRWSHPATAED